jgi:chemotaxis protein methyltransferase CheR
MTDLSGQESYEGVRFAQFQEDPGVLSRESQKLSDHDFLRLSIFIKEKTGIALSDVKKTMLQARLQKRLRVLHLHSFSDYCKHLFSSDGAEIGNFINVVTTNKTDFFREPHHFEYLVNTAIPFLQHHGLIRHHYLNVWSAACSTGMEPYTLAMMLSEYQAVNHGFSWSILGTDISTNVLEKASQATYSEENVEPIPIPLKKKYLLRSSDRTKHLVKIVPELRSHIEFQQLNFMQEHYELGQKFEVIFCRNAIIYFDRATAFDILKKITQYLIPGGFLFLGHSESLNGFSLPYDGVGTTIYQKKMTE